MDISDRIAIKMEEQGRSRPDLARALGVSGSRANISSTGKRISLSPKKEELPKIADFLNTTVEYLLTGKNNQTAIGDNNIVGNNQVNQPIEHGDPHIQSILDLKIPDAKKYELLDKYLESKIQK